MASLKQLALRGSLWTILSYGTSQALRLVANLILTRLLVPEVFGLMALVQVFIVGLALFSDIGITPSIIQNRRGEEPAFFNTAWTLQVIRGFGLWLGCCALAVPIASLYGEDRLLWLLPVVGLSTAIRGFVSTDLALLQRRLAIATLSAHAIGSQAIGLFVTLILVWINRSIWALVIGNLISSLVFTVWSHYLTSDPANRFTWERSAVKELFTFGKWIFVSTAMTFLASQADRLLLGKLLSFTLLGIYTVAFTFADLPREVVKRVSATVIFPVISQKKDLPRSHLRGMILEKRKLVLLGLAMGLTLLSGFGDFVILVLYSDEYQSAGWMLSVLALGLWPHLLAQTMFPALLAIGKPRYSAYAQFFKFLYMIVALPLGYHLMGVAGAVIAVALNDLPFYGAISYGLWREGLLGLKQDLAITCVLLTMIVVVFSIRMSLGWELPFSELLRQAV